MAIVSISLKGIEQAITGLNYKETSIKQRILMAIRSHYLSEDSIADLGSINTDDIVKSVWNTGSSPIKIRAKRRNFSSIKSSINADLKKLSQKNQNPENITINSVNIFDMSEDAKSDLLKSFANSVKAGEVDLNQVSELLKVVTDFLSDAHDIPGNDTFQDVISQVKEIISKVSQNMLPGNEGKNQGTGDTDPGNEKNQSGETESDGTGKTASKEDIEEVEFNEDEGLEEIDLDEDEDIEEVELNANETLGEVEDIPEEDIEEVELDEDEELEEIDTPEDDTEEIELDEDEDIEEVDLDEDEKIEDVELDEDEEIEDVELEEGEEIEEVDLDEGEILEEVDEVDETDDLEEIDELNEDEDLEEIEDVPEEDTEEVELDEDEELEEIDISEDDTEAIELDEDEDIEEVDLDEDEEIEDEEIEDVEFDEDEKIEEVDLDEGETLEEVDEVDETDDLEEIDELNEDEDLEEIDELDEDEIQAIENYRKEKELAEHFDQFLGKSDKEYNSYVLIPAGTYTVGSKRNFKTTLKLQEIDMPEVYIARYPVTNSLFEIFVEHTGYITLAEKKGFGTVFHGRFKRGKKTSLWKKTSGSTTVAGACWYQPQGPGSTLHGKKYHPVVQIGMEDAWAFASWIGRRLPSEAEWEACARTDMSLRYPWGNEWENGCCNIETSSFSDTTPVDKYDNYANEFKIADLLGNILEWTSDKEQALLNSNNTIMFNIAKGGGWTAKDDITITSRSLFKPGFTSNITGFRCISEKFL